MSALFAHRPTARPACVPALPLVVKIRSKASPLSNACDRISSAQATYPSDPTGVDPPTGMTYGVFPAARSRSATFEVSAVGSDVPGTTVMESTPMS